MQYYVPVTYKMVGSYQVDAESLEQAVRSVLDGNGLFGCLPHYKSDTMEIDTANLTKLNRHLTESDLAFIRNIWQYEKRK